MKMLADALGAINVMHIRAASRLEGFVGMWSFWYQNNEKINNG
jgi:hypothetical protein